MAELLIDAERRCRECDGPLAGRFCAECGHDSSWKPRPLAESFAELWDDFLALDKRFVGTVVALISQPGLLSKEYLAGRRTGRTSPLRLYMALAFVAALVTRGFATGRPVGAVEANLSGAHFLYSMLEVIGGVRPSSSDPLVYEFAASVGPWIGLVVFSPLLAFGLSRAFREDARLFVEHLIVSLHFQSFVFLVVVLEAGTLRLFPEGIIAEISGGGGFALAVVLYSALLIRSFYGVSKRAWAGAWIEAVVFFYVGLIAVMMTLYFVALSAIQILSS